MSRYLYNYINKQYLSEIFRPERYLDCVMYHILSIRVSKRHNYQSSNFSWLSTASAAFTSPSKNMITKKLAAYQQQSLLMTSTEINSSSYLKFLFINPNAHRSFVTGFHTWSSSWAACLVWVSHTLPKPPQLKTQSLTLSPC